MLMLLVDLALIGLVIFLAWRVAQLYRQQSGTHPAMAQGAWERHPDPQHPDLSQRASAGQQVSFERVDWISKAQIFAGIQMLDAKRKGLHIVQQQNEECRLLAGIYLIGAAKSITLDMGGTDANARDVAAFLVTHKLHMDRLDIEHTQLSVTRDELTLASYRCGLEGGSNWLKHHFVPDELSLFEAVTANALV